ncbi:Uncharacterised protein [Vibrio cholerae]|nr:Uncharacterised protein [Vibrio cholerae]
MLLLNRTWFSRKPFRKNNHNKARHLSGFIFSFKFNDI